MKTHQTNWSTNCFWRFLAQAWITENGNVVKKAESYSKNSWKNIKEIQINLFLAGFRRLEPLCTAASNAINELAEEERNDRLNLKVLKRTHWCDLLCWFWFFHRYFLKNFSPLSPSICCSIHTIDRKYEIDSLFSSHSYPDIYLLLVIENISG